MFFEIIVKFITSFLKLIYRQIEFHNRQSTFFSRIRSFCKILNNQLAINYINNINNHGKATSISYFDFLTLYNYTTWQFNKRFIWGNRFLILRGQGTIYNTGKIWWELWEHVTFSQPSTKKGVKYLLHNCLFFVYLFACFFFVFFLTWKQNIHSSYWVSYGIIASSFFCKSFSLLSWEKMDKENKKDWHKKGKKTCNFLQLYWWFDSFKWWW